jgi:hypothetical protein
MCAIHVICGYFRLWVNYGNGIRENRINYSWPRQLGPRTTGNHCGRPVTQNTSGSFNRIGTVPAAQIGLRILMPRFQAPTSRSCWWPTAWAVWRSFIGQQPQVTLRNASLRLFWSRLLMSKPKRSRSVPSALPLVPSCGCLLNRQWLPAPTTPSPPSNERKLSQERGVANWCFWSQPATSMRRPVTAPGLKGSRCSKS